MKPLKKSLSVILALALILTCALCYPVSAEDSASRTVTGEFNYDFARQVLKLVNKERKSDGKDALVMDSGLLHSAMTRAAECSVSFSHERPNGTDCFSIVDWEKAVGENIAAGQISPENVMYSWMNSAGHRENILNSDYTKIGVGCFISGNRTYWAQCFSGGSNVTPSEKTGCECVKVNISLTSVRETSVVKNSFGKHKTATKNIKATTAKNGKIKRYCKNCKKPLSSSVIYKIKSVKLSKTTYKYNGKKKKPGVTVKNSKGKTISKKHYTVSYSKGRKARGKYTVTVKFKNNYSGKVKRQFRIK